MVSIDGNKDVFTVIIRTEIDPERFDEVMGRMKEDVAIMASLPGFISLTSHIRHDKAESIGYLQWQSREDHESCLKHPMWEESGAASAWQKLMDSGAAKFHVGTYDIVGQHLPE